MNITSMALKAGAGVLTTLFPPAAALIPVINEFLPEDKKLGKNATGEQVSSALRHIPPEKLIEIEALEIKAEINESNNWASVQHHLAKADEVGNSTRPKIALRFANTIIFVIVALLFAVGISIYKHDDAAIKVIADSWEMVLTLITPMIIVIYQYFGKRTQEKRDRINAALGNGIESKSISSLISAIKGR